MPTPHINTQHPLNPLNTLPFVHDFYLERNYLTLMTSGQRTQVIDNSGPTLVECINVLGGKKGAQVGDEIVCAVKRARGASKTASTAGVKIKPGDVTRGVVVRAATHRLRPDGTVVRFDDNAVVLVNKQGNPVGTRILGIVSADCNQEKWAKIIAMAPKIV